MAESFEDDQKSYQIESAKLRIVSRESMIQKAEGKEGQEDRLDTKGKLQELLDEEKEKLEALER